MRRLPEAQSAVLFVIVAGYVGLTAYALVRWNSEISSALVTGFALMAQNAVREFFAWLNKSNGGGDSRDGCPTKASVGTVSAAEEGRE